MGLEAYSVLPRAAYRRCFYTSTMSKLNPDRLRDIISSILQGSKDKKRKFLETIELQVVLKNYDTNKDKRFAGSIKLPNIPRPNMSVCILGDAYHVEEAHKNDVPYMDVEMLKALNKDKKKVKKLANKYDCFLASQSVMKQIPRLLGPTMHKLGKFPTLLERSDSITDKIDDLRRNVKFQLKKVLTLGVAVANVSLTEQQTYANIQIAVNFLISLLKKNWQNVKTINVKSTMGPAHRIY